jgi:hypothetical protein
VKLIEWPWTGPRWPGACALNVSPAYTSRVGLDSETLGPLAILTWLIHSRSKYQHFTADAGGMPPAESLRSSLFFTLWEEQLRFLSKF